MDRDTSVWEFFTKKGDFIATCNTCHKNYNYKASVSNLRKHWKNIHGKNASGRESKPSELSESDRHNSDNSDGEQEKSTIVKKQKATWNYFEVLDSDKFEATCKICEKAVPFTTSSDLTQHIQEEHGEEPRDSDVEYIPDVHTPFKRRIFKSRLWKYFTPTNDKMAVCLLCKRLFNYASTITNLRRHLLRKHRGASTPPREDREKMFRVSENGMLYEIEAESGLEENGNEDEEDPMATDTVYLNEDQLEFLEEPATVTPSPKKQRLMKPNVPKIINKRVHRSEDTCSGVLELPRKQVSMDTPSTMTSLDYFGQYVVSMLKELPKPVSDQLQSIIVKQILTSKMALEPQAMAPKYEIQISQNNADVINVPEPVSYTVVQSAADEKSNEITESVVQE